MRFPSVPAKMPALLLALLLGAAPAFAAPGGGKGDDKGDKHEKHEHKADKHEGKGKPAEVKQGAFFNDKARSSVQAHYAGGKDCPPGLAKKHNGCMPPGQARKWQVGHAVPASVVFAPVPRNVLVMLPPAPVGHRYVAVDGDVLLIAAATRTVVDGISISVTIR